MDDSRGSARSGAGTPDETAIGVRPGLDGGGEAGMVCVSWAWRMGARGERVLSLLRSRRLADHGWGHAFARCLCESRCENGLTRCRVPRYAGGGSDMLHLQSLVVWTRIEAETMWKAYLSWRKRREEGEVCSTFLTRKRRVQRAHASSLT